MLSVSKAAHARTAQAGNAHTHDHLRANLDGELLAAVGCSGSVECLGPGGAHALPGLLNSRLASSRLGPARPAGAGTGAGEVAIFDDEDEELLDAVGCSGPATGAYGVAMRGDEDEEMLAAVGCSGPERAQALPGLENGSLASSRLDMRGNAFQSAFVDNGSPRSEII